MDRGKRAGKYGYMEDAALKSKLFPNCNFANLTLWPRPTMNGFLGWGKLWLQERTLEQLKGEGG